MINDKNKQELKLEREDDSVEVVHFSQTIDASFNEILDYQLPERAVTLQASTQASSSIEDKVDSSDQEQIIPQVIAPLQQLQRDRQAYVRKVSFNADVEFF